MLSAGLKARFLWWQGNFQGEGNSGSLSSSRGLERAMEPCRYSFPQLEELHGFYVFSKIVSFTTLQLDRLFMRFQLLVGLSGPRECTDSVSLRRLTLPSFVPALVAEDTTGTVMKVKEPA